MIPSIISSHPQPIQSLYCLQHGEPVKGICFFNGKCEDRLMCRNCRKTHDSNHLNYYEELDDLLHGDLIDGLKNYLESIINSLDNLNNTYENNSGLLISQIDYLVKEIQTSILKKLTQTKDMLMDNLNKKTQKNNTLKLQVASDLNTMMLSFNNAISSKFNPPLVAEEMVQAICKAQALRENLENDPEVQSLQIPDLSISNLVVTKAANSFQQMKATLDQICQDIETGFITSNSAKQASIPKGKLIQGNPMLRQQQIQDDQNSMLLEQHQRPPFINPNLNFSKSNTPMKDDFYFNNPSEGNYGYQNRGFGQSGRNPSYGKEMRDGRDLRDRDSKLRMEFSPQKIYDIFQMVNQEEQKRGAMRSLGKQKNVTARSLLEGLKENRNEPQGQQMFENEERKTRVFKPSLRKKIQLLEPRDRITTIHKEMLFGSLAYLPAKQELATAGTEGSLEIIDVNTMESIDSFKAHKSEIFRILYIPKRNVLLTTGRDGEIHVFDCRQQYKLTLTFKKHTGPVYALESLDDNEIAVSGGEDKFIRMWNINNGKEQWANNTGESKIGAMCRLRKMNKLAVGFDKGHVNIINLGLNKKIAFTIPAHKGHIIQNLVSIDEENLLISSADDEFVKVWRLYETKSECIRRFSQEKTIIRSFIVNMEKDLLITNHDDHHLRIWNLSSGKKLDEYYDTTFGESMVALENRDEIATANLKDLKFWIVN